MQCTSISSLLHAPFCCREALRATERRDGVLAEEVAALQRQLAQLMEQPLPISGSRASSRLSSQQGSRPSSRGGPGDVLAPQAPKALAASPAADASCSSPRIQALRASSSVDGSTAGDNTGSAQSWQVSALVCRRALNALAGCSADADLLSCQWLRQACTLKQTIPCIPTLAAGATSSAGA